MRRALSKAAYSITPPIIWNAYLRARGLVQTRPWQTFGHMQTCVDAKPLVAGRFAEIHDRYCDLNPFNGDGFRYRHYNACYFASLCRHIPGDFVCAGVSFGATAKIVYEFVDFPTLGKTFHLIDPLEGVVDESGRIASNYNRDPDYVLRQYPPGAPVVLHRERAPLRLPGPLAFVLIDIGNLTASAESLPVFYEGLSPGGMIVAFEYGQNTEYFAPIVERLGITPFWLPSGQAVIVKQ
jgi:hypothetical protein